MFVNLTDEKDFLIVLTWVSLAVFNWTSFHMFIGHLHFFFEELLILIYFHLGEAMLIIFIDLWKYFYTVNATFIKTKIWV